MFLDCVMIELEELEIKKICRKYVDIVSAIKEKERC